MFYFCHGNIYLKKNKIKKCTYSRLFSSFRTVYSLNFQFEKSREFNLILNIEFQRRG